MSWVLAKFRKSYSIMCWCKKRHSYLREIFHFKILVLGFGRNTLWFNLLKTTCRDGIGYEPEEVVTVFPEVISVSVPSESLIIFFRSWCLAVPLTLCYFFSLLSLLLQPVISSSFWSVFLLSKLRKYLLCIRTTFKKRSTSPLRSSFSPSSRCFLPFCYHQPFSS